jgi:hypothetical protein
VLAALLIAMAMNAPCTHAQLDVRLGRTEGAAGSFYTPIIFENTSGTPCTLRGYPGVSSTDRAHGAQIGRSATREPSAVKTITLKAHGGTATALLRIVDTGVFDPHKCHPKTVKGLRIYAPNQTEAFFHVHTHRVCTTGDSGQSVRPAR